MGGLNTDFGSHQSVNVERVTEPSDALNQVLQQNNMLKQQVMDLRQKLQADAESHKELANEMRQLAQFRQVINNPIEHIAVEFHDGELLRTIRGHMIEMFGRGGQMDADGRWAQTVVNQRLQVVIRQLVFMGLQRWPQVKAQLNEIIAQQGLMR